MPTPDHFIPLLYFAGVAAAADRPPDVLIESYAYGSLSMTCYTIDADCPEGGAGGAAGDLPDPHIAPTDETNV